MFASEMQTLRPTPFLARYLAHFTTKASNDPAVFSMRVLLQAKLLRRRLSPHWPLWSLPVELSHCVVKLWNHTTQKAIGPTFGRQQFEQSIVFWLGQAVNAHSQQYLHRSLYWPGLALARKHLLL